MFSRGGAFQTLCKFRLKGVFKDSGLGVHLSVEALCPMLVPVLNLVLLPPFDGPVPDLVLYWEERTVIGQSSSPGNSLKTDAAHQAGSCTEAGTP